MEVNYPAFLEQLPHTCRAITVTSDEETKAQTNMFIHLYGQPLWEERPLPNPVHTHTNIDTAITIGHKLKTTTFIILFGGGPLSSPPTAASS
jgi:hypothetical protein